MGMSADRAVSITIAADTAAPQAGA